MLFLHPLALMLLLIPLALLMYSLYSKKETITSTFASHVQKKVSNYRLFLLVLFLLIIALAQPVWNPSTKNNSQETLPLVIALDISKSMLKSDVYPSRLELGLLKIKTIMESDFNLRVGLLLFAKDAFEAHPLSEDKNSVNFIAQSIDYAKVIQSETNLFAAIEGALLMLKNYESKNLFILSDITNLEDFKEESLYADKHRLNMRLISITSNSHAGTNSYTYSSQDIDNALQEFQKELAIQKMHSRKAAYIQLFYFPLALGVLLLLYIYSTDLVLKNKAHNAMLVLLFTGLSSLAVDSEASVLDFYYISDASSSFKNAAYERSLSSYKKLPQTKEVLYNTASTQYKLGLYEESISNYMLSLKESDVFNAKVYYNVANAYLQLKQLHLAKKYYKKSLSLRYDTDAQENLNQVMHILSNQKHKMSKAKTEKYKLPQRISLEQKELQNTIDSTYVVSLKKVV